MQNLFVNLWSKGCVAGALGTKHVCVWNLLQSGFAEASDLFLESFYLRKLSRMWMLIEVEDEDIIILTDIP